MPPLLSSWLGSAKGQATPWKFVIVCDCWLAVPQAVES